MELIEGGGKATIRRKHLRDADTICTSVLRVPGSPLRCELAAGHEGERHKNGCTRW